MDKLTVVEKANILGKILNVYGDKENPLFLAKDIAEWIEHTNVTEMVRNLEEKTEKLNSTILSSGQNREVTFLTEDGVYEVLMTSRKPIAKDFRKGFKEFLKSWRKGEVKVVENKPMSIQQMLIITLQEQDKLTNRVDCIESKVDNEIRVDSGEQRKIQRAVGTRVYQRIEIENNLENKNGMFQSLHRDLKNRFGVASYRDIKRKDFISVLKYISTWIEPVELRNKVVV